MSNVVRLKGYLAPPRPRRQRQKSQYERYPMPFFNRKTRCTWDVKPTGDYFADCETGKAYALEFLKSCDGTVGWTSLLPQIASDMISAGPQEPPLPGGFPRSRRDRHWLHGRNWQSARAQPPASTGFTRTPRNQRLDGQRSYRGR